MFLESFDCRSKIQNHVCWMVDLLTPSMQCEILCRTTWHLESRNHQSSDWQTNRLIPKPGNILHHWVFLRLRILIEEQFLLCLFLFDPFLCLCCGECLCLHFCRAGTGENNFLWKPSLPFDKPFLPFFPLDHQTRSSSCHHSGPCAYSSKECSSGPFGSSSAFSFSISHSYSHFHLAALERSGLPSTLSVVPCPETWSFIINVALLVSHLFFGPLSKFVFSVVFHDKMLFSCC